MDLGLVRLMVLMGLVHGLDFGVDRANILENLPRAKPKLPWANRALLTLGLVLTLINFLQYPELSSALSLGSMWLGFLVGYTASATVAFLITRYLARRRRSV